MTSYLSLDFATCSGIAYIDLTREYLEISSIKAGPLNQASYLDNEYDIDVLITEGQFFGPNAKTTQNLAVGIGSVKGYLIASQDISTINVAQATSRSFNGVNTPELKENFSKVKDRSIHRANELFNIHFDITNDEADALLQARFVIYQEEDIDISAFKVVYFDSSLRDSKARLAFGRTLKLEK